MCAGLSCICQLECAGREDVTDVWVDGQRKMAARVLKGLDIPGLDTRAELWQNILKN